MSCCVASCPNPTHWSVRGWIHLVRKEVHGNLAILTRHTSCPSRSAHWSSACSQIWHTHSITKNREVHENGGGARRRPRFTLGGRARRIYGPRSWRASCCLIWNRSGNSCFRSGCMWCAPRSKGNLRNNKFGRLLEWTRGHNRHGGHELVPCARPRCELARNQQWGLGRCEAARSTQAEEHRLHRLKVRSVW